MTEYLASKVAITFFFPTRFHVFEQILHADLRGVTIYSVYPNRQLRRGRFAKLAACNRTLWLGLLVYSFWRLSVRLRAPKVLQSWARRLYFQAAASEFALRLGGANQTIVCSAGYLGKTVVTLQRQGHRVVSNHGSLYERYVAHYLRDVAGLDGNRDQANWVNPWLLDRMDQEFAAADRIIVCSHAARVCLPNTWQDKCRVVPLGAPDWTPVDTDGARQRRGSGITFFHVSSLVPQKNPDRILDAFSLAKQPADRLLVGGPSPIDPHLRNRLTDDKDVYYLGRLNRMSLQQALAEADVFVHPSLADGWAMTVTEALGSGLPVVSSSMTGAAEYYHSLWQSHEAAEMIQLVDPLSVDAIADGMRVARVIAQSRDRRPIPGLIRWPRSSQMLFEALVWKS